MSFSGMTLSEMTLSEMIVVAVLPVLVGALLLAGFRLLRGPHILDRVIALDYMTVVVVGILGLLAMTTDQAAYLDIAMVVALLSFLGTVGFAFYVEQRQERSSR